METLDGINGKLNFEYSSKTQHNYLILNGI